MMSCFITVEGIDGSGKSTITKFIASFLQQNNLDCITTKEPGGTRLGDKIRELLLYDVETIDPMSVLLMIFASRSQHINNLIKPQLNQGKVVICDRFIDSTLAYQCGGDGIDEYIVDFLYKILDLEYPNLNILT